MVDLTIQDTSKELLDVVTEFATSRVRPAAAEAEEARCSPPELARALHQMGAVPGVDDEFGGQGRFRPEEEFLLAERLAYGDPGIALELLAPAQAAMLIDTLGDADQRERYLTRIASGPEVFANVLYYEGFGRSPSELDTKASRNGQSWSLSGRKIAVVRPGEAEFSVVLATAGDELSAFVLEREQLDGLHLWRDDQVTGKLGVKAARTGIVDLAGVEVPEAQRLAGGGQLAIHRAIARFRSALPALALGAAGASLDYARAYADERVAFGNTIISYQGVAFPLADVAINIDATRLNLLALLTNLDASDDPEALQRDTAIGAHRALKAAVDATRIGVNSLGGHGYLMDHPVERWYRAVGTLSAIDFDPLVSDLDVI